MKPLKLPPIKTLITLFDFHFKEINNIQEHNLNEIKYVD